MENKTFFDGLNYEGYYDDVGNFCISISKETAEEVLGKITSSIVTINN